MSNSEINTGKHFQSCFTVENTAVAHMNPQILQNQG